MEEYKSQDDVKLIFGLGPFATLINSVLLLFLSPFLNAIYFCVNFSEHTIDLVKNPVENPWYITFPLFLISWLMFVRYIEWRYGISPKDFSIKNIMYKMFFLLVFIIVESTLKIFFIHNLISVL